MNLERDKKAVCLRCGKLKAIESRGLCSSDYRAFTKQLKLLGAEFETYCIEKGLVLPAEKGGRPRKGAGFADVVAEFKAAYKSGVVQQASDLNETIGSDDVHEDDTGNPDLTDVTPVKKRVKKAVSKPSEPGAGSKTSKKRKTG